MMGVAELHRGVRYVGEGCWRSGMPDCMRDVDVGGARRSLMVLRTEHQSTPVRRRAAGGELTRAWLNFLCIDVVDLDAPLPQHHKPT